MVTQLIVISKLKFLCFTLNHIISIYLSTNHLAPSLLPARWRKMIFAKFKGCFFDNWSIQRISDQISSGSFYIFDQSRLSPSKDVNDCYNIRSRWFLTLHVTPPVKSGKQQNRQKISKKNRQFLKFWSFELNIKENFFPAKMILMTMIARVADGLPLAASIQEDEQVRFFNLKFKFFAFC